MDNRGLTALFSNVKRFTKTILTGIIFHKMPMAMTLQMSGYKQKNALLMYRAIRTYIVAGLLLPSFSYAQTGPGGVGNPTNNSFWIRADRGTSSTADGATISSWTDGSGNAINLTQTTAAQQPLYRSNVMNGYPALQFDNAATVGQNDYMTSPNSAQLDGTSGLTIFSVVRPSVLDGDARAIVSKRNGVAVDESFMFFFYTNNYLFGDIVNIDNRFNTSPNAYVANNNYIVSLWYNGTLPAAQRSRIYAGNTLQVTAAENDASIPNYPSPLLVGTTHIGDPRPFGGYIAEVAIYREALNETRRIIVNNYLSAKYNIPLAANDVYTMDNPANGDFDHEMAGIGRISATDLHNDARGSSIVRISNPDNLTDGKFMLWGHNNANIQANQLTGNPATVQARMGRTWRVSEVTLAGAATDVGAVTVSFDLTGLGPVTASHLRLLVDTNNDGLFSDETPISGATSVGGNVYQFTNITALNNQTRFTLGTINKNVTPLPITLVSFNAELNDHRTVDLQWVTASETNNDHFTVERSSDLNSWTPVSTVQGAGNSNSLLHYVSEDQTPMQGVNYYRLKQTDLDGAFTYSDIRSVLVEQGAEITLFPNPAKDQVVINRGGNATIMISNTLGQALSLEQVVSENSTQVSVSGLPAGSYFVTILENGERISKKLIVE